MKAKISSVLFISIGVVMFIYYGVIVRFMNPDMTDMRLFLTYWYGYLIAFVFLLNGYLLINARRKK